MARVQNPNPDLVSAMLRMVERQQVLAGIEPEYAEVEHVAGEHFHDDRGILWIKFRPKRVDDPSGDEWVSQNGEHAESIREVAMYQEEGTSRFSRRVAALKRQKEGPQ